MIGISPTHYRGDLTSSGRITGKPEVIRARSRVLGSCSRIPVESRTTLAWFSSCHVSQFTSLPSFDLISDWLEVSPHFDSRPPRYGRVIDSDSQCFVSTGVKAPVLSKIEL